MDKPKISLNELIHEGATVCFDWVAYLNETPPDLSFGLHKELWEPDKFQKIQKYFIDAVNYINFNKLDSDEFGYDFQDKFFENKHYLTLSLFGNKIEEMFFADMDASEVQNQFKDEDFYYGLEEIKLALDFAAKKLETITKENK